MAQKEFTAQSQKRDRERARRTRTSLRNTLLRLLETKSLEQITIRELTAEADVAYATYFRNYADKEALLHELAADEIRTLLALSLPLFFANDSPASTRALCTYIWEHRSLWRALLTGGAASAMKAEYLRQALEVLKERPTSDSWLPGELAVSFSVTALVEIIVWWLKQENPPSAQDMAIVVHRLAVAPVMP